MAKFSRNVPKEQQKTMTAQLRMGRNPVSMVQFLAQRVPIKLDYHNVSPRGLLKLIRSAPAPAEGESDVLVLIGHSKEHISDERFEDFCKLVAAEPDLEAVTLSEVAEMLR